MAGGRCDRARTRCPSARAGSPPSPPAGVISDVRIHESLRLGDEAFLAVEPAALVRDGRRRPRRTGPLGEQTVRLLVGQPFDDTVDLQLLHGLAPVEDDGGVRVGGELLTLAARGVGGEDQAGRVHLLDQHHPHGRHRMRTIGIRPSRQRRDPGLANPSLVGRSASTHGRARAGQRAANRIRGGSIESSPVSVSAMSRMYRGSRSSGQNEAMTTPLSGTHYGLTAGDYTATIASVGASLRTLQHHGRDLVVPFEADEIRPAYRGATLAPWPNRVDRRALHVRRRRRAAPPHRTEPRQRAARARHLAGLHRRRPVGEPRGARRDDRSTDRLPAPRRGHRHLRARRERPALDRVRTEHRARRRTVGHRSASVPDARLRPRRRVDPLASCRVRADRHRRPPHPDRAGRRRDRGGRLLRLPHAAPHRHHVHRPRVHRPGPRRRRAPRPSR